MLGFKKKSTIILGIILVNAKRSNKISKLLSFIKNDYFAIAFAYLASPKQNIFWHIVFSSNESFKIEEEVFESIYKFKKCPRVKQNFLRSLK